MKCDILQILISNNLGPVVLRDNGPPQLGVVLIFLLFIYLLMSLHCLFYRPVLFILIGDIVWAASSHYDEDWQDLGYSFALSVVGSILILAGGAISFVGGR